MDYQDWIDEAYLSSYGIEDGGLPDAGKDEADEALELICDFKAGIEQLKLVRQKLFKHTMLLDEPTEAVDDIMIALVDSLWDIKPIL